MRRITRPYFGVSLGSTLHTVTETILSLSNCLRNFVTKTMMSCGPFNSTNCDIAKTELKADGRCEFGKTATFEGYFSSWFEPMNCFRCFLYCSTSYTPTQNTSTLQHILGKVMKTCGKWCCWLHLQSLPEIPEEKSLKVPPSEKMIWTMSEYLARPWQSPSRSQKWSPFEMSFSSLTDQRFVTKSYVLFL